MMRQARLPQGMPHARYRATPGPASGELPKFLTNSAVIARVDGSGAAEYPKMFLHQQEQLFNSAAYDFVASRQYTAEYCDGLENVVASFK
ncbi:hypothetical protein [Azospirillum thiophilum]|uniref:hypothetical protein n=1 Tax=Azospirillum thiophilum TaxID=528244 RepID=UPI000AA2C387|nr:hypothetical protein [Azospirillum thiophilum]